MLKRMFEEGMDGIRLNLSHTTLEEAAELIERFHTAAREAGRTAPREAAREDHQVAPNAAREASSNATRVFRPELMIDMQGPELRVGRLEAPLTLEEGTVINLESIPLPDVVLEELQRRSKQEILLDDGKILLETQHSGAETGPIPYSQPIKAKVIRGGVLTGRKRIALPGCLIDTPAMTAADLENIRLAKQFGVTAVMQPFVRSKEDLMEVRRALDQAGGSDIRLFAKIENLTGLSKLDELIPCCDEIVIARGDLGNAMELWELPAAQKKIAAACRKAGRDFMVVTQMLESMTHRKVPSRAEVSDIFNAVLDGAASVMVTGETAAGEYPEIVIRYLARTVREAEKYMY